MKMLAIIGLSLATALSGVVPAEAFPTVERPAARTTDIQQVESYRSSWGQGRYGGNRRIYRRHYRNHDGYYRRGYDDFGIGLGGFAAGAIIGGMLAQPRYYAPRYNGRRYYSGGSHADWCYARYRSYRAYDNTYQPYNGGRRQCVSP